VGSVVIRVAVIEDHPVFRIGLGDLLERSDGVELVGVSESFEAFADADATGVDVVLLDLHLPGLSGPDAVAALRGRGSAVLVLSADGTRQGVLEAIAAGAAGYVTKDADPGDILAAVRAVAAGGSYVSPTLASFLLEAADLSARPAVALTNREREILALVAAGERDTDIAERLFISVRTVGSHLDRIRDKTGQRRRVDLTRYALSEGIEPAVDPRPS
jgi:DNA-binding NarL/FixJ family response regulator